MIREVIPPPLPRPPRKTQKDSLDSSKRLPIYKSNIYHIVKLQAFYRGHLARKQMKYIKPFIEEQPIIESKRRIEYKDGSVFEGQVLEGMRHGYGEQKWVDGIKYTGYWENDNMSGKGKLEYPNGDIYDCYWVNNKAKGFGELVRADGSRYRGEWEDDRPHGEGTESWPDGTEYKGTYIHGLKNGRGTYLWNDGTKYEGEWVNDKIEGYVNVFNKIG